MSIHKLLCSLLFVLLVLYEMLFRLPFCVWSCCIQFILFMRVVGYILILARIQDIGYPIFGTTVSLSRFQCQDSGQFLVPRRRNILTELTSSFAISSEALCLGQTPLFCRIPKCC